MVEKDNEYNIYKIETEEKIDIKKVIITIGFVLIIICLIIFIKNLCINIKYSKICKQYESQIAQIEIQNQSNNSNNKDNSAQIIKYTPQLTDIGKENIKHIYSSDSEKKRAFLTFDDGPSSQTPYILEILKKENIKATFFMLGSRVENSPNIVKQVYKEGHYIANHGYSHVYSSIYSSPESVLEEYTKCNIAVQKAIENPEYDSHLFRFPGGLVGGKYAELKKQAKEILNQNNIVNVDWNALNGDAETQTPTIEFELQKIKETTENKKSIVILMHDSPSKEVTVQALPQIIQYLKEQGYEFKNFYEIIK